ncbi:MBL fold metallo-hydrolase [Leptobacterium flavescens]|uniref:MBL fold metallo-hydrolase n=1 Tax=Leptobacterium flavescens TaxID=472055 RepID=A0A6P0UTV5_9FLAO|nr:MBL fold metallo-hydrolase [Leptobacterium flavescens]NER13856.1 MBL fold metallo-hydrolase [Leptobacterium flavescens]
MKKLIILPVLLMVTTVFSQRISPDKIDDISIHPITHGTLALEWNNKVIYVDPFGGGAKFEGLKAPDIILITDIHGDHLNPATLKAIETSKATFVVPQAVADRLPGEFKKTLVVINNGEKKDIQNINIEAIPMYNLPEDETSRHTKGRGNGYVVKLGKNRIYLSGDTEDIPEMRALKNIDIAFVCMNLPFTMNVEQAADAVLDFKPKIVYPYHYRGRPNISDTQAFKKLVNDKNKKIEVRLRNWYQ